MDLRDLIATLGLVMLGAGCYFIHPPLGLIIPGALITWKAMR